MSSVLQETQPTPNVTRLFQEMYTDTTAGEPYRCVEGSDIDENMNSNTKRVSFDSNEECQSFTPCINASACFHPTDSHDSRQEPQVIPEVPDDQSLSIQAADSKIDAIHELPGLTSVLKRPRYASTLPPPSTTGTSGNAPLPDYVPDVLGSPRTPDCSDAPGLLVDEISPTDIVVGDADVGVLDLPNVGNSRFLAIIQSKIRIFAKLKKNDRLRMAQATAKIVHSVGGRFLSVNTSTGLFHEISEDGAWTNCYMTYRDILLTHKRDASMRRLRQVIQQQELLMCKMKAAKTGHDHDDAIPITTEQQGCPSRPSKRSRGDDWGGEP